MYKTDPNIPEYGPLPTTEYYQTGYGYEKPVAIHGFEWSATFNHWRALVTFANVWRGVTSPSTLSIHNKKA